MIDLKLKHITMDATKDNTLKVSVRGNERTFVLQTGKEQKVIGGANVKELQEFAIEILVSTGFTIKPME